MAVYLAALLTLGVYASAVPVKFALMLRVSRHARFGAGTSLFEGRFALRKAEKRASGEMKHLPWQRLGADFEKLQASAGVLRRLLRATHLDALRLSGRIGLTDAAQTALTCGLLRSAEAALGATFAPGAVRFDVRPDFSGGGCELMLWCMFSVSAGHIILGALSGASETLLRRLRTWTGIPLKIS